MVVVSLIEHLGTLVQISRQDILPFAHKTESLTWPSAFLVSPPVRRCRTGQVLVPTSKVQEGRGICPQVRGSGEGGYFKGTSVAVQLLESTGMSQTAPCPKTGKTYWFSDNRRHDRTIKLVNSIRKYFSRGKNKDRPQLGECSPRTVQSSPVLLWLELGECWLSQHRSMQGDHIRVKSVVLLIMNVSSFLINSLLNVRSPS